VAVQLFDAGTDDVLGRLDRALACGGGVECPANGLRFTAPVRGTYLLDVYPTGPTGDYRFTWTVRNEAGLPIEVPVPACSPNGDGVQDRWAWTAGAIPSWTVTSFVTRGAARVAQRAGPGEQAWDGGGAAPNPFEPRPQDGDRDTTTFAMTSSEPGRLRVVISRADGATLVRSLQSDPRPGRPSAARLDRADHGRDLAAGPLLVRDRGHRRRRQHRPVGPSHRACAVKHNSPIIA
jgi:hypothetical protein